MLRFTLAALVLLAGTAATFAATCSGIESGCFAFCSKNRSATSIPTLSACRLDCEKRKAACMSSGRWQLGVNPRYPQGYRENVDRR
jgi:hypothetical protein